MRQIKQEWGFFSKVKNTTLTILAAKSTLKFIGNSTIKILPEKTVIA